MKSVLLKKRITVRGEKVQDVGYRLFLLEIAESIGLKGFQARNMEDYVEFLVEGDEKKVVEFLYLAKTSYPEFARVEKVIEEDYDGNIMPVEGFYRSFSLNQLVKIVNVGVEMVGKQDLLLEKQDSMLEKQDVLINEVRNLRDDLKTYMEKRFQKIELEIAKIKEKIGIR